MILRIKGPSARLRPRGGGKALALMALALAGCQAKSPDIIVQGSSPQDAMRFLENYQKSEKKDILRLSHYTKSLRENHAPGFDWEAYWTEIQTRKLYQSLSPKELEEIFSLKDISCREENLSAYGGLLLAAARHDSQKMLFSGELRQLDQSCGPLPHAALKGIVGFLSQKRKDLERAKLAEERRLILKKPSAERSAAGHIYTGELQKVLALEWSRGPASRSWGDILEPLDREFWADARYISLRDGDREHLQAALQMERALKGGLSAGSLNQDVFLIFGEEGKMQALMEGAGYRNYLTPFGRALNWENLWRDMRAAYPEDPKNGNTEALLDLHAAASCGQRAAAAYQALAEAWGRRSYATAAAASCKERLQRQVQDAYKIEDFLKMAKSAAMDVFQETFQKHEEAAKSKLDLLDKALNGEIDVAGALDKDFAWGNLPHSKSIKRAFFVLWAYQSEKARHYKKDWKNLLERHFSQEDWLKLMAVFRETNDRSSLVEVLDMHQYIYGEVLFLEADVRAILESESLSAADLSKKYGYPAAYLERDSKVRELLSESFWASLKESLSENPGALLQAVQIFEGERQRADEAGGGGAASKLKANWRKLFSANAKESDWLALMRDLRAGAAGSPQNKAHVKSVLDMHQYIYGEVLFLEADVRAILESESLSAADLSKKYGYPAAYLERDSKVRELLSESFWASLKESLSENPQKLMEFVEAYEADREAGALPSELFRQKWSGFALRHFLVTDWLNLMAALRESSDRAGIVKVFDMHHFLYGGEVLFLADDIFAILKSEKASIKDLESYGYRPSDTNDPAALRAFWRAVQAAVREEAPFGKKILVISGGKNIYPAAVLAGGSACSFEGAKNIYRLFSRFGRERDLFEGFRFAGCAEFLDQFTKEEWKRLAGRSAGWSFSGAQSPEDFKDAWWLARILALRSTSAAAAETAAAQISSAAWQSLMGGMLASYSHSYPASGNELFLKTLQSAQLAYGPGAGGAVCRFFSKEARGGEPLLQSHRHQRYRKEGKKAAPADISHSLVRHFDPYWLMEVFQDLSWEPKSGSGRRGREKANCSQILSERQRNMLLFALSFSVFSEIYREEGILNDRAPLPRPDLIPKIWAGAAKILSLSTKISRFEPGDKWSVAFKSLLSLSQDMDDYSFAVNFSHQILRQVLFLSGNDEALALSRLESGAWQSQPETEYHKTYRNWIRELLRDPESLAAEEDSDGGFFNIPLPFELASWREPSAKTSSPSAKTSSPSAGASEPSAKSRTPSSEAADHQPKMDYARVFIEDIQKDGETSYEISVFGGADLLNPSAQSYFAGGGLQYRLSPLMSAGLEASVYKSEPAAASKAVEEGLRDYGLRLGYPLPKYSVYLSSRYNIFKSHLNFAGFFKGRADFPALFGLGLMGMNSKKTYLSAKIQAGPRLRLFKWLGLHFFLSLSIASAGGSEVLLYPWMSLGLNFNL